MLGNLLKVAHQESSRMQTCGLSVKHPCFLWCYQATAPPQAFMQLRALSLFHHASDCNLSVIKTFIKSTGWKNGFILQQRNIQVGLTSYMRMCHSPLLPHIPPIMLYFIFCIPILNLLVVWGLCWDIQHPSPIPGENGPWCRSSNPWKECLICPLVQS